MRVQWVPIRLKIPPERQSGVEPGQQGRLLLLARIACIMVVTLALGLFVVTFPAYFAHLHQICTTASCSFGQSTVSTTGQLSVNGLRALHSLGQSVNAYAVLQATLVIISELPCVVVAAFLLWRKSDNWTALLVAVLLVTLGTSYTTSSPTVLSPLLGSTWAVPIADISNYFGAVATPLIFSLFPNGRFVPRWIGWLVPVLVVSSAVLILFPTPSTQQQFLGNLGGLIFFLILIGGQIYRYRRVSTPVERQQTKWVIFGFSFALLLFLVFLLPELFFPSLRQPDSPYQIFGALIGIFSLTLPIALSFGLAILRYHLYDIDVLINRTLVYGTLTTLLALLYFGLILSLQWLVHLVTGTISEQPLVIVASTLVIAALFHPLRRRIQAFIDRRFYRHKYDAAKTLEAFSSTLRHEVDLEQLKEKLVAVVSESMHPSHVSLWLRPTKPDRKEQTVWRSPPAP